MPTYSYRCQQCNHTLDIFQKITEEPIQKCPKCQQETLKRLIGVGAGFIFKGSGFYITDYRSKEYKDKVEAEYSKKTETSPSPAKTAESTPTSSTKKEAS